MAAIGVQATIPSCLKFPVRSREVALVSPAKPTPYEFKTLSDIDDQDALRFQLPLLWFYSNASTTPFSSVDIGISGGKCQREVGRVIRDALSEALVYYYPLAGRIRESPNGKLTIECNGEGVLYIEADADIRLEQFGPRIQPPFSCDQLLSKTLTESNGILNTPVLVIQVTHLLCGGFVFATRLNHCMMDGSGIAQFLGAVAEIARGAKTPSILPVWEREMITAREPPRVTHTHHEYLNLSTPAATTISSLNNSSSIVAKYNNNINNNTDHIVSSFFFGKAQISALRNRLPPHLKDTSSRSPPTENNEEVIFIQTDVDEAHDKSFVSPEDDEEIIDNTSDKENKISLTMTLDKYQDVLPDSGIESQQQTGIKEPSFIDSLTRSN
ncbi:hypothetical protein H6P81_006275 [Aristolochia fimbriata]|uniref:Uncharacterized protein n=1 Tax=Aristolochia fimbriata TaxID=158543 RepID=A0AAV7EZN0_ARIFI|nr:hypothetical protein H6P81_006275 [Aristolochia fimbriata]